MTTRLRGTWFVLPTPFGADGSPDLDGQRRLVEAAVSWGVDGLTAMGVTSEVSSLTPEERAAALEVVFEAAGDSVPVVVGCSGGSAEVALDLMARAKHLGAAGAMVSAPPLHRDVESLPAFFERVAGHGDVPVVVQDEPAATGVVIPTGVLHSCVVRSGSRTVKLEDPPTAPKIARLLEMDADLDVFGGLGGVSALAELRAGACGTMTGFAFPEILRAIRTAHQGGDQDRAAAISDRYLPLVHLEAQTGIGLGIRKELLRRRGVMDEATTRRGGPLDGRVLREIDEVLERVGVAAGPEPLEVG